MAVQSATSTCTSWCLSYVLVLELVRLCFALIWPKFWTWLVHVLAAVCFVIWFLLSQNWSSTHAPCFLIKLACQKITCTIMLLRTMPTLHRPCVHRAIVLYCMLGLYVTWTFDSDPADKKNIFLLTVHPAYTRSFVSGRLNNQVVLTSIGKTEHRLPWKR